MKQSQRQGFTVVELVVVIAMVAVLAAVLVPTFSSVFYNARKSNDVEVCEQMNKALLTYSAIHGQPEDIETVRALLTSENPNNTFEPKNRDCAYYWFKLTNKIYVAQKEDLYIIYPDADSVNEILPTITQEEFEMIDPLSLNVTMPASMPTAPATGDIESEQTPTEPSESVTESTTTATSPSDPSESTASSGSTATTAAPSEPPTTTTTRRNPGRIGCLPGW